MKKKWLSAAIGFLLIGSSTAGAAESPFADAPDWSYTAVKQLIAHGVVDGLEARTFDGQVMTRYEMARLAGRALYHQNDADEVDKTIVEKLAKEFSDELAGYAAGESKAKVIEKKQPEAPPITFSAYARQRVEFTQKHTGNNRNTQQWFRYFLLMNGKLDDNFNVHVRYGQDDITSAGHIANDSDYSGSNLHWLYLDGNIGHNTRISLGRQPLTLGYGLVADIGKWWDGARFDFQTGATNFKLGYMQRSDGRARSFAFAEAAAPISRKADVKLVYFKDHYEGNRTGLNAKYPLSVYNTTAIGAAYRFDKNIALKGEFGHNFGNDRYKASNGYYLQVDYKGAKPKMVGSWGTWLQYRCGGNGFDLLNNMTTLDKTMNMPASLNDTHGFEYGFSYVPIKQVITTLKYWNLQTAAERRQALLLQMEYLLF